LPAKKKTDKLTFLVDTVVNNVQVQIALLIENLIEKRDCIFAEPGESGLIDILKDKHFMSLSLFKEMYIFSSGGKVQIYILFCSSFMQFKVCAASA
jgi:hypothetical protein